jgi:hypothetical protein
MLFDVICSSKIYRSMAQKPIAMEQLKQILQLHKDGVGIREMARRTGISRNSVRKYLALLSKEPLRVKNSPVKPLRIKPMAMTAWPMMPNGSGN